MQLQEAILAVPLQKSCYKYIYIFFFFKMIAAVASLPMITM